MRAASPSPGRFSNVRYTSRMRPVSTDGVMIGSPDALITLWRGRSSLPSTTTRATSENLCFVSICSVPRYVMSWPKAVGAVAGLHAQLQRALVAAGGRQRHGDDDDAEVHDHAAVGPADQAAPALAARGQRRAGAGRRRRRNHRGRRRRWTPSPRAPSSTEMPSAATRDTAGQNSRSRSSSARRLAPRQHRGDGHEREQAQADGHRQPVEERRAHRALAAVERLTDEREHGAQQHHEGEGGEHHVVGQEGAFARHRRVDAAGRAQAIAAPADEARATRTR